MQEYEKAMKKTLAVLQEEEFTHAFFGDIFLEDLKEYRENNWQLLE